MGGGVAAAALATAGTAFGTFGEADGPPDAQAEAITIPASGSA
jgi:hypothetical protein